MRGKKVFKTKIGYVANTLAYILLHACSLGNVPHWNDCQKVYSRAEGSTDNPFTNWIFRWKFGVTQKGGQGESLVLWACNLQRFHCSLPKNNHKNLGFSFLKKHIRKTWVMLWGRRAKLSASQILHHDSVQHTWMRIVLYIYLKYSDNTESG